MSLAKINGWLTYAVITLLVVLGISLASNSNRGDTIKQLSSINKELNDSVTLLTNKYGEVVAKKSAAEADLKLLKEVYGEKFEAIEKHLNINAKQVRGIFSAVTKTIYQDVGTIDTIVVDDTNGITNIGIGDHSPWHDFRAEIQLKPYRVDYYFESRDSITLVPYRVGRDLYVKGLSANPNARITGLQGILVATDPKRKPWGIGPSIQIGYDTQIRITPGISVQYSLIRF